MAGYLHVTSTFKANRFKEILEIVMKTKENRAGFMRFFRTFSEQVEFSTVTWTYAVSILC